MPVDVLVRLKDQMGDVGTVETVVLLNEALRPDELCRADDRREHAQDLRLTCVADPLVGDGRAAAGCGENHVEVMNPSTNFADPELVLDRDGVTASLEVREHARIV